MSFAQQAIPHVPIKIPANKIRLDSLSRKVFRQSHYIFSFNSQKIHPGRKIIISKKATTLNELLSSVSQQLNIRLAVKDTYVFLYKNAGNSKQKNPGNQLANSSGTQDTKGKDAVINPVKHDSLNIVLQKPDHNKHISSSVSSDALIMHQQIFSPIVFPNTANKTEANLYPGKTHDRTRKEKLSTIDYNVKNAFSPYLSASVSGDETMYLNASVHSGFRVLFGTIDWSTNFKKSMFFYGIGTSFSLVKNWAIELSGLTGGKASNDYSIGSGAINLQAKTFLSRMNLTMKKQIAPRVQLKFGPVINLMNTKYYYNDSLVPLKRLFPTIQNPDKTYYGFKAPYTITNNINSNALINKKMWIGFHIGLIYLLK